MKTTKYGFIGTGNMGGALAEAVCKFVDPRDVMLADCLPQKAAELAQRLGCVSTDNEDIAANADYIFIGVKPQVLPTVFDSLSVLLGARKTPAVLVTMAAGIPIKQIMVLSCGNYPIIRIMPNTPVSIGKGLILCSANERVTDGQLRGFSEILSRAGTTDFIDEKLIDAASALSGCGPAFAYMFIEALADGAVECGLPRDKAIGYASQTLAGAAGLVLETGKHPELLKDEVCSPGGSTIAGVYALESGGFRASAMDAVKAAFKRTKELGS